MRGLLTRRGFSRRVDAARIRTAIEAAERRTSGEVVVSVSTFFWGDVQAAAERAFERLGVANTRERSGVLIFIVPSRRRFVILGDEGIHARAGQALWDEAAARLSAGLRAGDPTTALAQAIAAIGEALAAHFPHAGERDVNELADEPDLPGARR